MSLGRTAALLMGAAWVALVLALSLAVPQWSDGDGVPERPDCTLAARLGNGLVLCLDPR
jgi:hypothetical protein